MKTTKTRRTFIHTIIASVAALLPASLAAKVVKSEQVWDPEAEAQEAGDGDLVGVKLTVRLPKGMTSPEGYRSYTAYIRVPLDVLEREDGLERFTGGELLTGAVSYELARDGLANSSLYNRHRRMGFVK